MPSILPAFLSGGALLVSGNPFSGQPVPPSAIRFYNSISSSGSCYVGMVLGLNSGGITSTSGGDLSSGGLGDGMEIPPNGRYELPRGVCSGQLNKVAVQVAAAVSGRVRLFWDPY